MFASRLLYPDAQTLISDSGTSASSQLGKSIGIFRHEFDGRPETQTAK
jgi:hypothetical protein